MTTEGGGAPSAGVVPATSAATASVATPAWVRSRSTSTVELTTPATTTTASSAAVARDVRATATPAATQSTNSGNTTAV